MADGPQALPGGFSHPGKVVRVGDTVRRPPNPHAPSTRRLLAHLDERDSGLAPVSLGVDDHGRELFSYIDGNVPLPPYPSWAVADAALEKVGALLRRYHHAVDSFVTDQAMTWAADLADPLGGPIVCHNDVCLENIVFRERIPVALLDFDHCAPGRPVYDIAMTLRLCGPVRHPASRGSSFGDVDVFDRIGVFYRGYRFAPDEATALPGALLDACRVATRFVAARAADGFPWFAEMWSGGGAELLAADEVWVLQHADEIREAALRDL